MGLATHAIALALGYALGSPEGRARLTELRGQVAQRPEVKQARERAWDVAGEAGVAVKNRLTSRSRTAAAESAPAPATDDRVSGDTPPVTTATAAAARHAADGPTSSTPIGSSSTRNGTTASGPATSGPATSGPATSGPATSGPATSGPATSGAAATGSSADGPTPKGTAASPEPRADGDEDDRLAGTTVAEDSKAAALGLPAPAADRPTPPAARD